MDLERHAVKDIGQRMRFSFFRISFRIRKN